jgi:glycosyltransferase involved in cell wall biosynthesis
VKVSVCIVTYNHEAFLAEALESVVAQETSFPIEVIVGEDGSADNTRAVLLSYQQKYSDVIKPILQPRNVGVHRNLADVLAGASGEYIAILDGDDYWTNPHKLQKQSDLLDAHPEFSMCFHRGTSLSIDDPASDFDLPQVAEQPTYTLNDLLTKKNFMFTHSTMLRGKYFRTLPPLCMRLEALDYSLYLLSAEHGDVAYIPENMCTHRRHRGSAWFGVAMKDPLIIQMRTAKDIETIDRYYRRRYATQLRAAEYYLQLANQSFAEGKFEATRACLRGVLRSMRYDRRIKRQQVVDLMRRVDMPRRDFMRELFENIVRDQRGGQEKLDDDDTEKIGHTQE